MSKTFFDIVNEYNALSANTEQVLLYKLRKKLATATLVGDIDIISDATLPFLMVADAIEALPKDNSARQQLALDFLCDIKQNNPQFLDDLGIVFCEVKPGTMGYAIPYTTVGKSLNNKDSVIKSFWRGVYLIINAIYVKKERYSSAWFKTASIFHGNFLHETELVNLIPGLAFNPKGVRHDMLCATNGTPDPDFIYTENGRTYTAEFKLPTYSVEALAKYAKQKPSYIYNAKILFTYCNSAFYKIDYTVSDNIKNTPYTIEKLDITKS